MISIKKIKHDISFGRQKVPIPSPYGIPRDIFPRMNRPRLRFFTVFPIMSTAPEPLSVRVIFRA